MSPSTNISPNLIVKPIVYGNVSKPFGKKRESDGHTHEWTVYVKPFENEDMSSFVKKVQFRLHDSYSNYNRIVTKPPYEVSETGWGEFEIQIKIYFHEPLDKPVVLYHILKLFHTTPNKGPTTADSQSSSMPESSNVLQPQVDGASVVTKNENVVVDSTNNNSSNITLNKPISSTMCNVVQGRRVVISEGYDEIVFQDPNEYVQAMLTITRPVSLSAYHHETDFASKQTEILTQIKRVRNVVENEIEEFKAALREGQQLLRKASKRKEAHIVNTPPSKCKKEKIAK